MKILYWNITGIDKPRLAIQWLISLHKPNFFFIIESKSCFDKLSCNWFLKLGYKFFEFNNIPLPSLWCFCRLDIDLIILEYSDQFLAFTFFLNNKAFATYVVYSSNNLYNRKVLCKDISDLQTIFSLWLLLGISMQS